MRWMLLIGLMLLSGCAGDFPGGLITGSIGGGSSGGPVGGNLHLVRVPQNAGDNLETVQNRALIEAARQARLAGATHFVVVRSADSVASADSLGSLTRSRPDYQIYIRIVTLPPDAQLPAGAVSVEEIERFVAAGDVGKPKG